MSRYAIAGENDADVMPRTRNERFGVWGISHITFRKSSSLTYVTQERKEWQEAIRRIAEELEHCLYKKRKKVLVQLKTRINAYGLNSTEVLDDEHIWRQIQKIEPWQIVGNMFAIATYFATAIQLMTDVTEMLEMDTYESCINKISGATTQDKNRWKKCKD